MAGRKKIREMLQAVRDDGRTQMTEYESKNLLSSCDVSVPETKLANEKLEAVKFARDLKYPVVMKIVSPEIKDKSEAGCVKVGITSEIGVRQAFENIIDNAKDYDEDATLHGVAVQKYVPEAQETVIGLIQDETFGPTVMFGLSGIWTEILEDVSFRLAPVEKEDAEKMVKEIQGYRILSGSNGEPPADISAVADIIEKISQLPMDYENIAGIDLSPVFAKDEGEGAIVIDARIVLTEPESQEEEED